MSEDAFSPNVPDWVNDLNDDDLQDTLREYHRITDLVNDLPVNAFPTLRMQKINKRYELICDAVLKTHEDPKSHRGHLSGMLKKVEPLIEEARTTYEGNRETHDALVQRWTTLDTRYQATLGHANISDKNQRALGRLHANCVSAVEKATLDDTKLDRLEKKLNAVAKVMDMVPNTPAPVPPSPQRTTANANDATTQKKRKRKPKATKAPAVTPAEVPLPTAPTPAMSPDEMAGESLRLYAQHITEMLNWFTTWLEAQDDTLPWIRVVLAKKADLRRELRSLEMFFSSATSFESPFKVAKLRRLEDELAELYRKHVDIPDDQVDNDETHWTAPWEMTDKYAELSSYIVGRCHACKNADALKSVWLYSDGESDIYYCGLHYLENVMTPELDDIQQSVDDVRKMTNMTDEQRDQREDVMRLNDALEEFIRSRSDNSSHINHMRMSNGIRAFWQLVDTLEAMQDDGGNTINAFGNDNAAGQAEPAHATEANDVQDVVDEAQGVNEDEEEGSVHSIASDEAQEEEEEGDDDGQVYMDMSEEDMSSSELRVYGDDDDDDDAEGAFGDGDMEIDSSDDEFDDEEIINYRNPVPMSTGRGQKRPRCLKTVMQSSLSDSDAGLDPEFVAYAQGLRNPEVEQVDADAENAEDLAEINTCYKREKTLVREFMNMWINHVSGASDSETTTTGDALLDVAKLIHDDASLDTIDHALNALRGQSQTTRGRYAVMITPRGIGGMENGAPHCETHFESFNEARDYINGCPPEHFIQRHIVFIPNNAPST